MYLTRAESFEFLCLRLRKLKEEEIISLNLMTFKRPKFIYDKIDAISNNTCFSPPEANSIRKIYYKSSANGY